MSTKQSLVLLRQNGDFVILSGTGEGIKVVAANENTQTDVGQSMRFSQLDRITELELGKSITAVKCLSLSESYLQDHFPRFPVMPGVLMLEAMFQASMWLVRATDDFKFAKVVLRQSKSLKFQGFVQPGDTLVVNCEIKSVTDSITNLKVSGQVNGKTATSGRILIDSFDMADREGVDSAIDDFMKHRFRLTFRRLCNQLDNQNLSDPVTVATD